MARKASLIIICIFFLGLGIIIGRKTDNPIISNIQSIVEGSPIRQGGFKYINPLLECEYNQSVGETEYKPSKNKVEGIINLRRQNKDITDVSVYYRDLNNGPWFGINEKESYSPASLLKLPVMIAYYKLADFDPTILQKKITYQRKPEALAQSFIPQKNLEDGQTYTVDELIKYMMVYSDNNSLFLLEENIDSKKIDAITLDLGIETPNDQTPEDFMSVKSYASLIRVLYNASYIGRELSEKALSLMGQSYFEKGLVQGIPKGIEVANKFGERDLANGVKQLHDCGIVYYPKHPYLLCIMTRGSNYIKLSDTIGEISKQIYTDIDYRYH